MSLTTKRKDARINALDTAATYLETFDWSNYDEANQSEEDYELFLEECKKMSKKLHVQADKLRVF